MAPGGHAASLDAVTVLLARWQSDPSSDEPIVDDLLLDPADRDNSSVGRNVEVDFPETDGGLLDLNNFLFHIAVDHSSETLLGELFHQGTGDVSGMHVYESLQQMAARTDLLPPALEAFRRCLPISSAHAAGVTDAAAALSHATCSSSSASSGLGELDSSAAAAGAASSSECALLSLWPLIESISIEVPASRWAHLPPNLTVFDTPGTSIRMLQNSTAQRRAAAAASMAGAKGGAAAAAASAARTLPRWPHQRRPRLDRSAKNNPSNPNLAIASTALLTNSPIDAVLSPPLRSSLARSGSVKVL